MDLLDQLRALLPVIDPGLLTAQDRIALLDLFERASVRDSSVRDSSAA